MGCGRGVVAHGVLKGIDTEAAKGMPGVLGVYTAADLKEYGAFNNITALTSRDGSKLKGPARPILASDKVRFLGPVYIGDTLNLTYTIAEVDPVKRRSYGDIKIVNQKGDLVGVARHILAWVKDRA